VQVNSDAPSPPAAPPTVPGVIVHYWATARISNTIPQLFSFVLGNTTGTVSARATAGVADSIVNGSLILVGQSQDPFGMANSCTPGTNLCIIGGGNGTNLNAPQGIVLASGVSPDLNSGSATVVGNAYVNGTYTNTYSGQWQGTFTQSSGIFDDPMQGKGQPPVPSSLRVIPVLGNTISTATTGCQTGVCPPGVYMAMGNAPGCSANCTLVPTGEQLKVSTNLTFKGGGFDDYIFYGGLDVKGSANVQFGPGKYVMAGAGIDAAASQSGKCTAPCQVVFNVSGTLTDTSPDDAGRMIFLTDSTYPGLSNLFTSGGYSPQQLPFGTVLFDGQNTTVNLSGLNRNSTNLPSSLSTFAPAVIWQDQRSSPILYKQPQGVIDTSCTGGTACPNPGPPTPINSTQLPSVEIKNAAVTLTGMFYQPRGTWMEMDPGNGSGALGSLSGQVSLVTGGFQFKGTTHINLLGSAANNPPLKQVVALIE
jgi:hypothetical protein